MTPQPENAKPDPHFQALMGTAKGSLYFVGLFLLLLSIIWMYDYGNRQRQTDVTAEVIHKDLTLAANGSPAHRLVMQSGRHVWTAHVSAPFYDTVRVGERLPIIREVGPITLKTYGYGLPPEHEMTPLIPAKILD